MKRILWFMFMLVGTPYWVAAQGPQQSPLAPPGNPFGAGWSGQFNLENLEDLEEMMEQFQQLFDPQGQGFGLQGIGQPVPAGPRTYLGVKLGPVSPEVAHHLDLPAHSYQTVKSVLPGSPAEKAGLKAFDIITQVDDQDIMNAQQLVQWVAGKAAGDQVTVKVLRKGKAQEVTAVLAETEAPARPGLGPGGNLTEMMRRLQEQFGQFQMPPMQGRGHGAGGGPDVEVEDDGQGNRTTRMRSSSRSSMVHTDQGQFTYSEENGHKQFKVVDPNGKVAFDGPVNTKKERAAVPAEFQDQLERMDQGGGGVAPRAPMKPKKKRMPI